MGHIMDIYVQKAGCESDQYLISYGQLFVLDNTDILSFLQGKVLIGIT